MDLAATSALKDAVIDRYFWNDRQARLWQARAMALAAAGNAEGAGKALRSMAEALMPEIGKDREDFRTTAGNVMSAWRDRVFAIERDLDGAPRVSAHKSKSVEKELLEFAKSKKPVRPNQRGRRRRMLQRERLHQVQAPKGGNTIPPTSGRR